MESFDLPLRRILADRDGPEATALFKHLLTFVERRVDHLDRTRCRGLLSDGDRDEILGDVLFQLMEGALARFRGETMEELTAFVRTMTDRITVRRAQRRLRERETVDDLRTTRDHRWVRTTAPAPDKHVDWAPDSPLDEPDRTYLRELVLAGSKAELARRRAVSRAAVTQRVHRIRARVEALSRKDRASHESWLRRVAEEALA